MPSSNQGYWKAKLSRNVERDAENLLKLADLGFEVLVIWDCETNRSADLALRLVTFLGLVGTTGTRSA